MLGEHPSPDLLERYFINHASEAESAIVERHIFTCNRCFSQAASLDIEALAFTKACSMLGELESQGTRVLRSSTPESQRRCEILPAWAPRFQFRYAAAAAATMLLTVTTLSSVGLVWKEQPRATPGKLVQVATTPEPLQFASMQPALRNEVSSPLRNINARKLDESESEIVIVEVRFERPFMPPSRHIEKPELNMAHIPPSVVAPSVDPPAAIIKLPQVPKPRVRKSRRVLNALASPFKKLGGTLAFLRR